MSAEKLLESAHGEMEQLKQEQSSVEFDGPERNGVSISLGYQTGGLERSISAWYDENAACLKVDYSVWKDYGLEGREDTARLSSQETVAELPHNGDAVGEAVEKAYEASLDVTEEDLGDIALLD